jgi:uracil DNA glycosylase
LFAPEVHAVHRKEYRPHPSPLSDKCGIYDQKNTDLTPALSFREGEIQADGKFLLQRSLLFIEKKYRPHPSPLSDKCGIYDLLRGGNTSAW